MVKKSKKKKSTVKKMNKPKLVFSGKPKFLKWSLLAILAAVLIGGFVVYLTRAATQTSYTYNFQTQQPSGRMFTDDSPLNQPIPTDVKYKADAAPRLKTLEGGALSSLLEWAIPVFDVDGSSPKRTAYCYLTDPSAPWDTCGGFNGARVPIPNGAFAQRGSDGHMEVIDHSTRTIYSYWIWRDNCFLVFNSVNAEVCPGSASKTSMDSSGVGGGTNVAGLAGDIIRTYEIEQGVIDHALSYSVPNTCAQTTAMYYPASHADGTDSSTSCIPIGSRIQLDPTVNVDAIPGITKMEKTIAKALQKYGAYCNDTSGTFGISVEFDRTGRQVYYNAGAPKPDSDAFSYKNIPWNKLKMVEPQWTSTGAKAYGWTVPTVGSLVATSPSPSLTTLTPTPVKTPTPTPVKTPTPTPTPVKTPTPTPTPAKTPTPIGSPSPTTEGTPSKPVVTTRSLNFDWLKGGYYLELQWRASTGGGGIQDYTVTRNGAPARTTTGTSLIDNTGLASDTVYVYEVVARGKNGQISEGSKVAAKTHCAFIWCWLE